MMTRLGTTLDKVSLTDTSPSLISRIYLGPDDNVFEDGNDGTSIFGGGGDDVIYGIGGND